MCKNTGKKYRKQHDEHSNGKHIASFLYACSGIVERDHINESISRAHQYRSSEALKAVSTECIENRCICGSRCGAGEWACKYERYQA